MMRKSMAVIVGRGSNMTSLRAQYESLLPKYGNLWRRMAPRQAETTREPLSLLSAIENGQSVSLRVPSKCNACPWDSSCQGCSEPILEIDEESSSDSSIDTAPVRFDLSHLRLDDEKSEESEEVTSPQATSAKLENQEAFRDTTGNNDSSTTSSAGAMAKNDSNDESESSSSSSSSGTVEAGWDLSFLRLKEDNEEAKEVESESNTIGSLDDKEASDDDLFAAEQKWMEARAKEQEASSQLIDLLDDSDSDITDAFGKKIDPPIVNTRSKSHKIARRPRIEFDSDDSSSEEEEWDDKIQSPIVQQEESAASQVMNGSPTVIVLSDSEDNADDAWLDDEDEESANDTSQDGDSFDEATSRIPDMIVGAKDSARVIKGPSKACFRKNREQIADTAFAEFDRLAFDGALLNVELVWSNKLRTTAGLTRLKQRSGGGGPDKRIATIELSSKIIDEEHRLRSTLLHEMCHAAAWLVDGVSRPPHGACFKKWANIAMQKVSENEQVVTV